MHHGIGHITVYHSPWTSDLGTYPPPTYTLDMGTYPLLPITATHPPALPPPSPANHTWGSTPC